ncbi:hypothetical protein IAQ61_011313 [Plenodomus lingam]|uniref:uncharacterized protein n=1 Tax=Leptosphaeria maculans TaxID=5022 RepID=UPI0033266359|nr:hypothetical protein IAQ61_011313 [Plenodomus lingam]
MQICSGSINFKHIDHLIFHILIASTADISSANSVYRKDISIADEYTPTEHPDKSPITHPSYYQYVQEKKLTLANALMKLFEGQNEGFGERHRSIQPDCY